ncbi:cupin domain-containing protein [Lactococcus nasutitermitis]|uniref:Cupin domain-containing protein n=1 Tax=Lactococcus nasutitermitis TaxID=1652957 RepID=A0ABV9JAK4_9LACT|nr:cupin domain-containing protein [Lactococcus nasutitermitis]
MFKKGEKVAHTAFSGTAFYMSVLDENAVAMVEELTFPVDSRTNWHSNPCGQTILVTQGEMIYQAENEPAKLLGAGDVIVVSPNVRHWHGAISEENCCLLVTYKSANEALVTFDSSVSDDNFKNAIMEAKNDKKID